MKRVVALERFLGRHGVERDGSGVIALIAAGVAMRLARSCNAERIRLVLLIEQDETLMSFDVRPYHCSFEIDRFLRLFAHSTPPGRVPEAGPEVGLGVIRLAANALRVSLLREGRLVRETRYDQSDFTGPVFRHDYPVVDRRICYDEVRIRVSHSAELIDLEPANFQSVLDRLAAYENLPISSVQPVGPSGLWESSSTTRKRRREVLMPSPGGGHHSE